MGGYKVQPNPQPRTGLPFRYSIPQVLPTGSRLRLAQATFMRRVGIKTCDILDYIAQQYGGRSRLPFLPKDLYNKVLAECRKHINAIDTDSKGALGYLTALAIRDDYFSVDTRSMTSTGYTACSGQTATRDGTMHCSERQLCLTPHTGQIPTTSPSSSSSGSTITPILQYMASHSCQTRPLNPSLRYWSSSLTVSETSVQQLWSLTGTAS